MAILSRESISRDRMGLKFVNRKDVYANQFLQKNGKKGFAKNEKEVKTFAGGSSGFIPMSKKTVGKKVKILIPKEKRGG